MKFIIFFSLLTIACNFDNDIPTDLTRVDTCSQTCKTGICEANVCICEMGFEGTDCDKCSDQFQDKDENGTCLPTCANRECNNGICDDSSGEAICVCRGAFLGPDCLECEEGKQDNDGDGVCVEDCSTTSLECGDSRCEDSTGQPECVCPIGFLLNDKECILIIPADPGFSGNAWMPYGLAALTPGVMGLSILASGPSAKMLFVWKKAVFPRPIVWLTYQRLVR